MIDRSTGAFIALIDWGCAHWADPALEFIGMPLRAVPAALAGYRDVAQLDDSATAEARILWLHLLVMLFTLPRGAVPGVSWAEQPVAMLLDVLRYFLDDVGSRWMELRPP